MMKYAISIYWRNIYIIINVGLTVIIYSYGDYLHHNHQKIPGSAINTSSMPAPGADQLPLWSDHQLFGSSHSSRWGLPWYTSSSYEPMAPFYIHTVQCVYIYIYTHTTQYIYIYYTYTRGARTSPMEYGGMGCDNVQVMLRCYTFVGSVAR